MDAAPPVSQIDSREVAALRWYHTIELPGGVLTPGEYDLRPIVDRLPWPASLAGMRCLDIGSRDGFYAFHMERLGADEVVSLDIADPDLMHFPGSRPPVAEIQAELDAGNRAFETARTALGSRVERSHAGIYAATRERLGSFDFAVIGTLLHHLRDPARALAAARGVVDGGLLVNEAIIPGVASLSRRPLAELVVSASPFWSTANPAGLRRMVETAGFEVLEVGRPYLVPNGPGARRLAFGEYFAHPLRDLPRRLLLRRGAPHAWLLAKTVVR
ncbi:MAG: class I SAM-dependent methyltransferase [Solirubrobacterales bacterium]